MKGLTEFLAWMKGINEDKAKKPGLFFIPSITFIQANFFLFPLILADL